MNLMKQWTRLLWIALGVAGLSGLANAQADSESNETTKLSITPIINYVDVNGNSSLFEEHYWMPEGASGGIESLVFESRNDDGDYLRVDGQSIFGENDYELTMKLYKAGGSKLEIGATNYRKYYDKAGWYSSHIANEKAYVRDNDLHLDIGKAWIEWTTPLSENLTLTLGYEYAYKKGEKSSIEYGETPIGGVYPSYKKIDEDIHTLSLGLAYETETLSIVNRLSYQNINSNNNKVDVVPAGPNGETYQTGHVVQEDYSADQVVYSIAMDKWLTDWMVLGIGYMYFWQEGDVSLNMDTVEIDQPGTSRSHSPTTLDPWDIDEYSHTANLSLMLAPSSMFQFIAGVQAEYGKVAVDGDYLDVSTGGGGPPSTSTLAFTESDQLHSSLEESFELRLKVIPASTLYVRATFEQERWELQESDGSAMRDTDTDRDTQKYRVGFNTHPLSGVSLSTYYQKSYKHDIYTSDVDTTSTYSAFIEGQFVETDEVGARLSLQHTNWLQTYYKYTMVMSQIETETTTTERGIGSDISSHIATVGFTLVPSARFTLNSFVNYQTSRTTLPPWDRNDVVEDYQSETWSWINSVTIALTDKTRLDLGYEYLVTDDDQDQQQFRSGYNYEQHAATIALRQQFTDKLEGRLGYGYYANQDFDRGDAGDYQAHVLTAGLTMTF